MSTRDIIRIALAVLVVTFGAAQGPSVALAEEILIEAKALQPPLLKTTVGERVTFVNRSGRTVHVEFVGNAGGHRVFQVPTEIWAIFHRAGLHPYLVHVGDRVVLRGVVEAVEDPSGRADPHTCDSLTVMGECIER